MTAAPVRRLADALRAARRLEAPAWPDQDPPPRDPELELKRTLLVWRSLEIVERPPRELQRQLLDDAVRRAHELAEEHEPDDPEALTTRVSEYFSAALDDARCWDSFFAALECLRVASTIDPDGDGPPWFALPKSLTTYTQQRPHALHHSIDLLERIVEVWDGWWGLDSTRVSDWLCEETSDISVIAALEERVEDPGVIWYARAPRVPALNGRALMRALAHGRAGLCYPRGHGQLGISAPRTPRRLAHPQRAPALPRLRPAQRTDLLRRLAAL